ncbi:MAG TPA: hypothetical protein VG013_29315 [Gemmataceae bacterium]|jgi:hypothetical protein|nr:hypothetical protein [Gemmataceae bacterium]
MSAKAGLLVALALNVLWVYAVRAEDLPRPDADQPASAAALPPDAGSSAPGRLSNWITYSRPDCCGPVGGHGPVTYDIYTRTGPVIPFGGNTFGRALDVGWEVEGGGRSLFYNVPQDAAWVIDLGLSYTYNHSSHPNITFPLFGQPQHIGVLHRTLVNAGVGREYYLVGSANSCDLKWRAGLDVGGRYGTIRLDVFDTTPAQGFSRLGDIGHGAYVALHTDLEMPCGCCKFEAGFRAEYDHTWMDILPRSSNVDDFNLLMTAGVRF